MRVLGDVGERLLGDPVDHQLLVVAQRRHVAAAAELGMDPGAFGEVADLLAQRRHQAVVVERAGAQLARQVEQLLHRLVGQQLGLAQLPAQRVPRVLGGGLQPQDDRGERLVDLVVQVLGDPLALLLLRAHDGSGSRPPLGLEPVEHPVEGRVQAGHLHRLGAPRVGPAPLGREVGPLHRVDEVGQGMQHGDDAAAQHHERLAAIGGVQRRVRDEQGGHHRAADQQGVDGQQLPQEGDPPHLPPASAFQAPA